MPDREPPLLQEEQVVASELGGRDPIEPRTGVLAKRVHDLDVTTDGRGRHSRDERARRAGLAVAWSQTPPVTNPTLLRITRLPVGRRASGFVLVAQGLPIPPVRRGIESDAGYA